MRTTYKKCLSLILISVLLLLALFYASSPGTSSVVDIRPRQDSPLKKLLDGKIGDTISGYRDIPYHIKEEVAWCVISQHVWIFLCLNYILNCHFYIINSIPFLFWHSRLAQNTCVCLADKDTFQLPLSNLLFPRVWAQNLSNAFLESHPDPEGIKRHRAMEYSSFQRR